MNLSKAQLATFAKALAAALTALAGALSVSATQDGLTSGESVASVLTSLVAGLVTYQVPNGSGDKPKTTARRAKKKTAAPELGD